MTPKIICDICGTTLQIGDAGAKTITKRCFECVRRVTPGSPKNQILQANGRSFESEVSQATKPKQQKPPRLKFSYRWAEADEHNPEKRILCMMEMVTYEGQVLFSVGFPKTQLLDWVSEMKGYEDEAKMDEAKVDDK